MSTWFETFRPALSLVLGDLPVLDEVDRALRELRALAGRRMQVAGIRARLRQVARTIEREVLPAYDAARWTSASVVEPVDLQRSLQARLENLSPELAQSYEQVHLDLADASRKTYLAPAGEAREVLRAAIHLLAPDDDVRAEDWYVGHEGRPTQAERIRFIVQSKSEADTPTETVDIIDAKIGRLGRTLYQRASKSFHTGTAREEVKKIVGYVEAVLNEILPDYAV